MQLHNRINREELIAKMAADKRPYKTISFYKYYPIKNLQLFRDHLYLQFLSVEAVGRIYVANEGINAQMALPSEHFEQFRKELYEITFLNNIRLNEAIEENQKSFFKLDVKIREKIVADGIDDPNFNPSDTGTYMKANEWNKALMDPETVVIDMRNHYESAVGKFDNAICPDVDTFKEELAEIEQLMADKKDKQILMYCTGGIRCEKASSWMKHKGFEKVYHLEGGIINYVNEVKKQDLENKFKGINFVFDQRLGERISTDIIGKCQQCGNPADTHINCANIGCHTLFIQCDDCGKKFNKCCSDICKEVSARPPEEQVNWRKNNPKAAIFSKGRLKID